MPAEAVNELDAARACLERMIHRGSQPIPDTRHPIPESGISGSAMLAVQRMREPLDELSRNIERWRVAFPGEEFPETVLDALNQELNRAEILSMRAAEIGMEA